MVPACVQYLPVTFVLDTGAPLPLYLSVDTLQEFRATGLAHTDDMDEDFVTVCGRGYRVVENPRGHEPGNILGLRMIMDLGLQIDVDTATFESQRMRTHHTVEEEPWFIYTCTDLC